MKKTILLLCLLYAGNLFSQAWDETFDAKYFIGATIQNKGIGAEIGSEIGISNYLSVAINIGYVIKTEPLEPVYDGWGININNSKNADSFEKMNMAASLNLHLTPFFKMDGEKIDMSFGGVVGINGIGGQAGFKYYFSENFGLYFSGYCPIVKKRFFIEESSARIYYDFYTQPVASLGISFSL